ncbi:molybdate ABC transporter permease subunit [Bacillus pseudomycoides]|uniref:Molybdenum transport system permease n=2 Tax=Bacillus TaxID=1386 RepID=A0AA91VBM0_9BACI|nr:MULTISPECIES: molybdate ABC transporter permease subunit [Bacillus]PEB55499.1 molybdate ABC transporter permease subunit [Bacillus sp. AFS098217]PED82153.1 molybdate ABC transporter permease subunit [Bacillus pseudomycoides]PEU10202.1 molybdate ABC transporter permease subunit [Bacillus sp. AFS019443]PEU19059.1 molybdate ABC transporter permease subunit [Bacillus sp. AFS014408]PFW64660.1 molybdate ABC transporter permease subunit [Bacillus sp. AFS075034]
MALDTLWSPVFLSLRVAACATIIVMIFGTVIGRVLARSSWRYKVLLETIFLLPMVLPPTVIGFFLIIIFGNNSPIGKWIESLFQQSIMFTSWAAVIASTIVSFPLMYQSAKTGFSIANEQIEDGARDLGASEYQVFLHVTLPLAFPALLSGMILSFVRALGEFGATLMFAGNIPGKTQTIPTAIYMAIDASNMQLAWTLVIITVSMSLIFLLCIQFINKRITSS